MKASRRLLCGAVALAIAAAAAPSGATTLVRASLPELVAKNRTVVIGEVLDSYSYWNEPHTFMLTDVRVRATEVLKGDPRDTDFTVTILGGTVDDLTTLIVGGAELVPGKSYVLFLQEDDLPGVRNVRTVREHSQGVFDIVKARDGVRAISQAIRLPLHPDALGFVDPPGGAKGFLLDDMVRSIRDLKARQDARQEVK
jgi:hypothetical protein